LSLATAVLMLLTPLGILAAGTAWGEWSPKELPPVATQARAATSAAAVPAGLQRLSNLWTAPFPEYAPSFVRSRSFGYLLSAMFGIGFLLCVSLGAQRFLERHRGRGPSTATDPKTEFAGDSGTPTATTAPAKLARDRGASA
jgi:cobalt/nickel transport system permease protein